MMYHIEAIDPLDKKRRKVRIGQESFPLYLGEIRAWHLEEGSQITEELYGEICEVLKKRVRQRCMHLLEKADRTQAQLEGKLKEGGYPPFLVEDALEYVKGFHYVDDQRFAQNYIAQQASRKSIRRLKQDLLRKGVESSIIEDALAEEEIRDEDSLMHIASRKAAGKDLSDPAQRQKLGRYLLGKGYGYSEISRVLRQLETEAEHGFLDRTDIDWF